MSSSEAMSEMVEKVARAICMAESDERGPAAYAPGSDPWNVLQRSSKRPYYAMARAAIEAMMEPTKPMVFHGMDAMSRDDLEPTEDEFRRGFVAALRSSLKETASE